MILKILCPHQVIVVMAVGLGLFQSAPVTCAAAKSTTMSRELIIDGEEVRKNDYPFFIASDPPGSCGGSLIGTDLVLTAAHCCGNDQDQSKVPFKLFKMNDWITLSPIQKNEEHKKAKISKVIRHPNYISPFDMIMDPTPKDTNNNAARNDFDFCLVKLEKPVSTVKPNDFNPDNKDTSMIICLPEPSLTIQPARDGQDLSMIGFGLTQPIVNNNMIPSDNLKIARIVSEPCPPDNPQLKLTFTNNMFCTKPKEAKSGRGCLFDSGGPAFDNNGIQMGLVSWGSPDCSDELSVYARVTSALEWIQSVACDRTNLDWLDSTYCQLDRNDCYKPNNKSEPTTLPVTTTTGSSITTPIQQPLPPISSSIITTPPPTMLTASTTPTETVGGEFPKGSKKSAKKGSKKNDKKGSKKGSKSAKKGAKKKTDDDEDTTGTGMDMESSIKRQYTYDEPPPRAATLMSVAIPVSMIIGVLFIKKPRRTMVQAASLNQRMLADDFDTTTTDFENPGVKA